ncbi:MAG TPA: transposase [Acidimicrobiia bacterium]|jgi:transposase|nr:transposase [Acidimicrobiia bacterium]
MWTETLLERGDEIFAFHETDRLTNGRIEGTNNKLGVLKRVAYSFTNTTNFAI